MSAQNYARELEQARAEAKKYEVKAHAVGMALAKKQAEVSRLKTENKKEIENVLTQDRKNAGDGCIDGFGHHGLQLYKGALGYGN
ncbi:putative phage associated membrane protein [Neisseria meningitidis]|nr:putative phage associated membrane protein [Neisseria meningitidis]